MQAVTYFKVNQSVSVKCILKDALKPQRGKRYTTKRIFQILEMWFEPQNPLYYLLYMNRFHLIN